MAPRRDPDPASEDARRLFWDQASHDLRQPVQSLQLLAQVFARHAKSDPVREAADHMRRVVDDLARMHEALVALSRLECGRTVPAPRALAVGEVVNGIVRELGEAAGAHGASLRLGRGLGARVEADPAWLALILRGLVLFALAQAEGGEVAITGRAGREAVTVTVAFPGPAIPDRTAAGVFLEATGPARDAAGAGALLGPGYLARACSLLGYRLELGPAPGGGQRGGQRFRLAIPRTR